MVPLNPALPRTLAIVDDDGEHLEFVARHFRGLGVDVTTFTDSNELLTDARPFGYDFYVVDLMLPGVDGVALIQLLRRRTDAGVLVVSGKLGPNVFDEVMGAGADMYLVKPVRFEQIELAIKAVHRRVHRDLMAHAQWRLNRLARTLTAPDGSNVELSAVDVAVLDCFVDAKGAAVTREVLLAGLGKNVEEGADGLNATIFRLRRRIERATTAVQPLQAKSRVGYVFRDPLIAC